MLVWVPVCLFATDKRHMILGKMYGWLEFKNFDFLNQRKNTITEQQVKDECEAPWKPIIIIVCYKTCKLRFEQLKIYKLNETFNNIFKLSSIESIN